MNCQDVQQLLAFADRKAEELDQTERAALQQHLEKCPDCAGQALAERHADEAVGAAMRDVPVPVELKAKILKRLAAERGGGVPWKWLGAAALILIAVSAGLVWTFRGPPEVKFADVQPMHAVVHRAAIANGHWTEEAAKEYLRAQGAADRIPPEFDYEYLQNVEVISFKGRPVVKLTYAKPNNECKAFVLILPWKQFRTNELKDDPTGLEIRRDNDHKLTYLIVFHGKLTTLYRKQDLI